MEGICSGEYVCIKALENGVSVIGMTRGRETRLQHIEKLDMGEVMIAQFTESVSAIKIHGNAKIYCRHGELESGRADE